MDAPRPGAIPFTYWTVSDNHAEPTEGGVIEEALLTIYVNGQELATAAQYGANLIVVVVDNGAYGTIRMHQEREYPGRVSATTLVNPDFAMLGAAYGGWSAKVETTAQFIAALTEAKERTGLRLIHVRTDLERIAASGATISALRARAKA